MIILNFFSKIFFQEQNEESVKTEQTKKPRKKIYGFDSFFQLLWKKRSFRDFYSNDIITSVIKQQTLSLIGWIFPCSKDKISKVHIEAISKYGKVEVIKWANSKEFFSNFNPALIYISAAKNANYDAIETFEDLQFTLPGSFELLNSQKRADLVLKDSFEFIKQMTSHNNPKMISWLLKKKYNMLLIGLGMIIAGNGNDGIQFFNSWLFHYDSTNSTNDYRAAQLKEFHTIVHSNIDIEIGTTDHIIEDLDYYLQFIR
jgi:hypothetical protein